MDTKRMNLLLEQFKEVKDVLDNYDIDFWLDCGTLLGAVRDGGMIEGDYDIDLGVYYDQFIKHAEPVCQELYNRGFDVYASRETGVNCYKNDEHVTLFL